MSSFNSEDATISNKNLIHINKQLAQNLNNTRLEIEKLQKTNNYLQAELLDIRSKYNHIRIALSTIQDHSKTGVNGVFTVTDAFQTILQLCAVELNPRGENGYTQTQRVKPSIVNGHVLNCSTIPITRMANMDLQNARASNNVNSTRRSENNLSNTEEDRLNEENLNIIRSRSFGNLNEMDSEDEDDEEMLPEQWEPENSNRISHLCTILEENGESSTESSKTSNLPVKEIKVCLNQLSQSTLGKFKKVCESNDDFMNSSISVNTSPETATLSESFMFDEGTSSSETSAASYNNSHLKGSHVKTRTVINESNRSINTQQSPSSRVLNSDMREIKNKKEHSENKNDSNLDSVNYSTTSNESLTDLEATKLNLMERIGLVPNSSLCTSTPLLPVRATRNSRLSNNTIKGPHSANDTTNHNSFITKRRRMNEISISPKSSLETTRISMTPITNVLENRFDAKQKDCTSPQKDLENNIIDSPSKRKRGRPKRSSGHENLRESGLSREELTTQETQRLSWLTRRSSNSMNNKILKVKLDGLAKFEESSNMSIPSQDESPTKRSRGRPKRVARPQNLKEPNLTKSRLLLPSSSNTSLDHILLNTSHPQSASPPRRSRGRPKLVVSPVKKALNHFRTSFITPFSPRVSIHNSFMKTTFHSPRGESPTKQPRGRPKRKARPTNLIEPNLTKKMRR